jgi:transposase
LSHLLDLQKFYPEDIEITSINETSDRIVVEVKSRTKSQKCPSCGCESNQYHSTYKRKISDLPILGRSVLLIVTAYKYSCNNIDCNQKVFAEELHGFAGWYRRRTARLEDLILTIASNSSCEGCSRICKYMGIDVSGDTIIRLLMRYAERQDVSCSEIIGVDDWAYKKGQTYGTLICDQRTHKPVALLDGRDGSELKKWLQNNKHITMITRDRASAYAKAISEVLPDVMQIADRFHLHQNLLKAIKDVLSKEIPSKIMISDESSAHETEPRLKTEQNKKK